MTGMHPCSPAGGRRTPDDPAVSGSAAGGPGSGTAGQALFGGARLNAPPGTRPVLQQARNAVGTAAAALLAAEAEFESALDRDARMPELRQFDGEVAAAEQRLGAALRVVQQVRQAATIESDQPNP